MKRTEYSGSEKQSLGHLTVLRSKNHRPTAKMPQYKMLEKKSQGALPNLSMPIIRAVRKLNRLSQYEMADQMDCTQGAWSKVENDVLEISAAQWIKFCREFDVPPFSFDVGHIESVGVNKARYHEKLSRAGAFIFLPQFQTHVGQTVRSILPFILYGHAKLGEKGMQEFFTKVKMDPDYFVVLNSPMSLAFVQALLEFFVEKNVLDYARPETIFDVVPLEVMHDALFKELGHTPKTTRFGRFIKALGDMYEIDVRYSIEEVDGEHYVRASYAKHVSEMKLSLEFRTFHLKFVAAHLTRALEKFSSKKDPHAVEWTEDGLRIRPLK